MELAGLKTVMDADFSAVFAGFKQAESALSKFSNNAQNAFSKLNIPNVSGGNGILDTQKALVSMSKRLQQERKLEIAGTKELLAVQKAAADQEKAARQEIIDAYNSERQAQEDNLKTANNIQKAIDAINKQKVASEKAARQAIIDSYNAEQQAQMDNLKTAQNLQKSIDAINKKKAADAAREADIYGQLVAENQALVRQYYNAAAAVIKYGDASGITAEKLEEMRIAALNGQNQLKQIEQGAGRFQRNVGNYSSALNGIGISAQYLTSEIPNFFQSMQIGLRSITNNIQPLLLNIRALRDENRVLAASGKETINVFKATVGAFLSWQTALLVGVGVLAKYGPALWDIVTSGSAAAEAAKELKERQDELNDAYKSGLNQAASQVAKIKELNATMTNTNLSLEQRTRAYNEAIKLYPSYLNQISKEKALSGGLADIINEKLIPAIMNAAKARGLENKITKLYEQEIDLREKLNASTQDQAKAIAKADVLWSKYGSTLNKVWDVTKGIVTAGAISSASDISDAKTQVEKYRNAIIETKKNQEDIAKQLQDQLKLTGQLDTSGKDYATYKEKAAKSTRTVTDALQDLIVKNKEADAELQAGAATIEQTLQKKISNYRSYIAEITKQSKFTVSFDDSRVVSAQKNIENLSNALNSIKQDDKIDKVLQNANTSIAEIDQEKADGVITTIQQLTDSINVYANARMALSKLNAGGINDSFIAYYSGAIKDLTAQLNNEQLKEGARKLQESFNLIDTELASGLITPLSAVSNKLRDVQRRMEYLIKVNQQGTDSFKELQNQMNQLANSRKMADFAAELTAILQDMTNGISENLGNLFSDSNFDFIGNLISLLGEQLKSLGKYLISTGITMEGVYAALKLLSTSGPIGAAASIVAGAAAVALGQYLSNQAKERASTVGRTSFASGGVVYGPTNALVGEYSNARSNPEVIAPLDKLTTILRNQNINGRVQMVPVIVDTEIKGQDLRIILKRANASFDR